MYVCKMYVMYVKIVGKRQRSLEQIDVKEFDFRCVLDSTVFTNPKGNLPKKKKKSSKCCNYWWPHNMNFCSKHVDVGVGCGSRGKKK